ncbi:MAG: hypothetical protein LBP86_10270 [Azoarcus sp.]|nr:hypothetical protein [Azoarcus sp.]
MKFPVPAKCRGKQCPSGLCGIIPQTPRTPIHIPTSLFPVRPCIGLLAKRGIVRRAGSCFGREISMSNLEAAVPHFETRVSQRDVSVPDGNVSVPGFEARVLCREISILDIGARVPGGTARVPGGNISATRFAARVSKESRSLPWGISLVLKNVPAGP